MMTLKQKIKISKHLSRLLRHQPEMVDVRGDVQSVLAVLQVSFAGVTLAVLREIVSEDEKTRYSFSPRAECIRANQGHSVPVDLGLPEIEPPEVLFHGTAQRTLWLILRDGLRPMDRQYVHLSGDITTALAVGKRHGEPVVLIVRAWDLFGSGHEFYRSDNGVWLTASVPSEYLSVHEVLVDAP